MNRSQNGRAVEVHLNDEEAFDCSEGTLPEARARHIASCASCAARVRELKATLALIQESDVPEPSPQFWEQLSARVCDAVRQMPRESAGQFSLLSGAQESAQGLALAWRRFWRFAVPCGAAVAALVLTVVVARPSRAPGSGMVPPTSELATAAAKSSPDDVAAEGVAEADGSDPLEFMATITPDGPVMPSDVVAGYDPFMANDAVDQAVVDLSNEEQHALVDLLRLELRGQGV